MNNQKDRLYFRQLLSGYDFGQDNQIAQQMINFVYFIGDRETGEAVIVDPAYDINGLLEILEQDGMKCTGVLATHYHPDHVGGSMMGYNIDGVKELLEHASVPIHAQQHEAEFIQKVTGYISVLRGQDPISYPIRLDPSVNYLNQDTENELDISKGIVYYPNPRYKRDKTKFK